jgi:hypothetical protein
MQSLSNFECTFCYHLLFPGTDDIDISQAYTASESNDNEAKKLAKIKVIRLSIRQMTFLCFILK